jgi:hypothetical protein
MLTDQTTKSDKLFPRHFNLQIEIPPFNEIALDVIDSIENDQLMVFDAHDSDAFVDSPSGDGSIDVLKRAKIPTSIKEWLCISFQVMRWDVADEFNQPSHFAMYRHNAHDVIFPIGGSHVPPGPTAFFGEIILRAEYFSPEQESSSIRDKLPFVIAHELTHAFDMLRVLVPAIQDWPTFWETALQEGSTCDLARLLHQNQGVFVDDYGSKNELATIAQYWPTNAEKWFKAFRG